MDLLGGYGSGSESDDSEASSNRSSDVKSNITNTNETSVNSNIPTVSKQKRRLLSLNAVLPSDIFQRLTRPPNQLDDSSDEEDGDYNTKSSNANNRKKKTETVSKNNNRHNNAKKNHVQSLLQGLKDSKLQNNKTKLQSSISSNNKVKNDEKSTNDADKMGFAFTNVVSVVRTSKKDMVVNSVHDQPRITSSVKANVSSNSFSNITTNENSSTEDLTQSKPLQQEDQKLYQHTNTNNAPMAMMASSLKRHHVVSAAPRQQRSSIPTEFSNYSSNYTQAPPHQNAPSNDASSHNNTATKMSKRDMQRALRAGKFHDVVDNNMSGSGGLISDIHQAVNTYAPSESTRAVTNARQAASSITNTISSEIYDPKTGGSLSLQQQSNTAGDNTHNNNKSLQQKLRSKHQIHQLVHSAKVLEAHRNSINPGGGSNGYNSKRVDAKRKYGW